jgi:isopenicillin N synthase-like dioxygenase
LHIFQRNFRGFSDSELTKQKVDWKEVFDFTSDLVNPEHRTLDIDGENQWPEGMPEFRTNMNAYFEVCALLTD